MTDEDPIIRRVDLRGGDGVTEGEVRLPRDPIIRRRLDGVILHPPTGEVRVVSGRPAFREPTKPPVPDGWEGMVLCPRSPCFRLWKRRGPLVTIEVSEVDPPGSGGYL